MRLLTWITAVTLGFALVCPSSMRAQQDLDSTNADPAHHKVEFENDQVRVVRYKLASGEQSARHSHPDSVIVVLTGGSIENTTDDGKTISSQPKPGDTFWRPALTHVTKNVGDQPIEGILVEPKNPHSARPAGSADVTSFPHSPADVVFENEQVRVLRYRFNAGQKDEMHGHPVMIGEATQAERNGILASLAGFPAITVPAGFSSPTESAPIGVPVGIEFLGQPFSEPQLLRIAYGFEQATHARKPPPSTPPLNGR